MYCIGCKKELPEGTKFCPACGTKQEILSGAGTFVQNNGADYVDNGANTANNTTDSAFTNYGNGAGNANDNNFGANYGNSAGNANDNNFGANYGNSAGNANGNNFGANYGNGAGNVNGNNFGGNGGNNGGYYGGNNGGYYGGNGGKPNNPGNKTGLIIGIIAGIVVLAAVVVGVLFLSKTPTIDLNDYVTVSFSGYESMGKAEVEFSKDKLEEDLVGMIKNNKKYNEADVYYAVAGLNAYCQLDKTEGLSNKDEVNLTWVVPDSEDEQTLLDFKIEYKDDKFKVSGLGNIETFDPFEYLRVEGSGVSPYGEISLNVESSDEIFESLVFVCDDGYNVANGQTITVYLYDNYSYSSDENTIIDSCAQRYGKVPSRTSKEYKIAGLPEVATSASQLSDAVINQMKDQALDVFSADRAQNWGSGISLTYAKYAGHYFLKPKNGSGENEVVIVIKVSCQIGRGNKGSIYVGYYFPVTFYNVCVDANGNCTVDLNNYNRSYNTYYVDSPDSWDYWCFYGYDEAMQFMNDCILYRADTYDYEGSINE